MVALVAMTMVIALVTSSLVAAATPPPDYPPLFGYKEVRSSDFKLFKKWNSALKRYTAEQANLKPGDCSAKTFNKCHYDRWQKFLSAMKGKGEEEIIKTVNAQLNRARYITDPVNWGVKDFWATPGEFISKFGDCEDYAITKYMSLKLLGFPVERMRVVAVKDLNLKIGHAILVVYVGDKALLLDNQIKQVVDVTTVRHYIPVFSLNEEYWWLHKKK